MSISHPAPDDLVLPSEPVKADLTVPQRKPSRLPPYDRQGSSDARLPQQGDSLFGFRLRHELGRGAFARVFLAEQEDLAGRPVVLKISGIDGDEPETLAQLQHTHIVPIYSAHEDAYRGLRAVCMPYFGGAPLSRVLETLWAGTDRPTRGQQLVQALQTVSGKESPNSASGAKGSAEADDKESTPLAHLESLSYIRACVWILVQLAEALEHAHQRGVLHRDIKPSNVLLGDDGQPMLLDFNVAQNLRRGSARTVVGGTVAYMAPEHLKALTNPDPALAARVDQRADIYSMGMVLYEMMAGCRPFDQSGSYSPVMPVIVAMALERGHTVPSLREKRPDVPWGLESIARTCLDPDPSRRYQRAEHLAEDLRRFLDDRPLKYAPELSVVERAAKWARRHPRLTSSGSVGTLAVLVLAVTGTLLLGHLTSASAKLTAFQVRERVERYQEGTVQALCLVNTATDAQDQLRRGLAVCEDTLSLYGVLDRGDWQDQPDWQRLDPDERQRLAEDTREMLLLLAWGRVRTDQGSRDVKQGALALLDRADTIRDLAPSRALWEERARYLEQLGATAEAASARSRAQRLEPSSARDHYLLATALAHEGRYAQAVQELDVALALNPRHYWSMIQRGICHQELGKPALAAGDFGACIGLWPESVWGYFNRGYVLDQAGEKREAVRDYSAALERDPAFVPAYLNRGLALLELRQWEAALSDFQKAAELGQDDAVVHAGLGVALEGLGRTQEADAAFKTSFARAENAPKEVALRVRWVYGFAIAARSPQKAREAFETVLRQQPEHPQALYGCAMLLTAEARDGEALGLFDRALDSNPNFVEARRYRAVLLARSGRFEEAGRDINWCLEKEPTGGATLYAAACVAALAADKAASPLAAGKAAEQALIFLERAFQQGYGQDRAAGDKDLKAVCTHPRFLELMSKYPRGVSVGIP
jgi:serine/threonine protein kinase/tetratricopeptide (TPR) repeat protein